MRRTTSASYTQPATARHLVETRNKVGGSLSRMIGDGLVRFSEEGGGATRPPLLDKYALALPLTDPGFDSSVLCEFRTRLLAGGAEALLLDTLLARLQDKGLL